MEGEDASFFPPPSDSVRGGEREHLIPPDKEDPFLRRIEMVLT